MCGIHLWAIYDLLGIGSDRLSSLYVPTPRCQKLLLLIANMNKQHTMSPTRKVPTLDSMR